MIHIFKEDGRYYVWSDTEVGKKDGRCLAGHENPQAALRVAIEDLETDLKILQHLSQQEIS
jgi:hypothetical protein